MTDTTADPASSSSESESFTVVTGKRKRENVSREQLVKAAAFGKIPPTAIIRREADGNDDWLQVSCCDWLLEEPEPPVSGYCLDCGARFRVTTDRINDLKQCPDCGGRTGIADFQRDATEPIFGLPFKPWAEWDLAALILMGVGGLFLIVGGIALFFAPALAVFLTATAAAGAGYLFAVTAQHRKNCGLYNNHITRLETLVEDRTHELRQVVRKYNQLSSDLRVVRQSLLEDTETECETLRRAAERDREAAAFHAKTVDRVAQRYLDEQRKWWTQKLRGDNYALTKQRITRAIDFVEKEAFKIPGADKKGIWDKLKADYEARLRKEAEQEKQRQIREQMREEQRAIREAKEAEDRAKEEQAAIQKALDEALARAGAEHSAEVEELQRQLAEAEERGQRAIAQAQLTKVGHVYIISNLGSFGEDVFKVGLTRRLEPMDRINELGSASVPFPFDVHMMIWSEDAPALEHALHKALHKYRVNRVNFRKEFFRVGIEEIHRVVESLNGTVEYVADAEALEYRASLDISEEDFAYLEQAAEVAGVDVEDDEG